MLPKRNYRTYFVITICFLLSIFYTYAVELNDWGNLEAQEYGDAVYCVFNWLGLNYVGYNYNHTGIFSGINTDDSKRVIESVKNILDPEADVVNDDSFYDSFLIHKTQNEYYGAYNLSHSSSETLLFTARKEIVKTAVDLDAHGPSYPYLAHDALTYDGSDFDGSISDIHEIRCDGVVEYCYEKCNHYVWWHIDHSTEWNIATSNGVEWHNNMPDQSPNPGEELSPWSQRGSPPNTGPLIHPHTDNSYMIIDAEIDFPTYKVSKWWDSDHMVVQIEAKDAKSGIHKIGYQKPGDSTWYYSRNVRHPDSDTFTMNYAVYTEGYFYYYAQDNGGNQPQYANGVEVSFPKTLTINSSGVSGVYIEIDPPDINDDSDGYTNFNRKYYKWTDVTLTAPATSSGKQFVNWSGVDSQSGRIGYVEIIDNKTVTANYESKPVVTVTAPDNIASEPGTNTGYFRISRTGSTSSSLTVYFEMSGSATNGTDYNSITSPVTITSGSSYKDIYVNPKDDTSVEGNEDAVLTLSSNNAYDIGSPSNATVTIQDNDSPPKPVISVTAPDNIASEPGTNTGYFRISRTGSTSSSLTVYFEMSGSATNGTDYNSITSPVTITSGSSYKDIYVNPKDDTSVEGNEDAVLTLSSNSAYDIGSPSNATVTIQDNDSAKPIVTVTAPDNIASEPGTNTGYFRISRTGSTGSNLTVYFTIGGSATNGTDYNSITSPVTITSGSSYKDIYVTPKDDISVEGDETVVLTLSSNSAYDIGSPSSATVTIQDNDLSSKPVLWITTPDNIASEPGSNTGYFKISRTGFTDSSLTVYFGMSGSATNGTDYNSITSPVTIEEFLSSKDIYVTPKDDTSVEGDETVVLTLSSNSAYDIGSPSSATVTIQDNDTGGNELYDDFEDGVINTSLWLTGGDAVGIAFPSPGNYSWSHEEVKASDGYLRIRITGPQSGDTYGADAWLRSKYNFNSGQDYIINFTWSIDINASHIDEFAIQITDGTVGANGSTDWFLNDSTNWKNLYVKSGQTDLSKTTWSISITKSNNTARLYLGPNLTGTLYSTKQLDPSKSWYLRFIHLDATSAGFPGSDNSIYLYYIGKSESPAGPSVLFYIAYEDNPSTLYKPPDGYVCKGSIHAGTGREGVIYAYDFFGNKLDAGWIGLAYKSDQLNNPPYKLYVARDDNPGINYGPPAGYVGRGAIHVGSGVEGVFYGYPFSGTPLDTGWIAFAYRTDLINNPPFKLYVARDDNPGINYGPPAGYVGRGAIHVGSGVEGAIYGVDFAGKRLDSGWLGFAYRKDLIQSPYNVDINESFFEQLANTSVDSWMIY